MFHYFQSGSPLSEEMIRQLINDVVTKANHAVTIRTDPLSTVDDDDFAFHQFEMARENAVHKIMMAYQSKPSMK